MIRKNRLWKRMLSMVLTVSVLSTTFCSGYEASAMEVVQENALESMTEDEGTGVEVVYEEETENSGIEITAEEEKQKESKSVQEENEAAASSAELYQNGAVCIYHEQQLRAIGTGAEVYTGDVAEETFGTGDAVTDEDGNPLTYALDGKYVLMNDIPLESGESWQLPAGFSGGFSREEVGEDASLYDAQTDTIFLYNNYQLNILCSDGSEKEPVMSGDTIAENFGMGKFLYPNGSEDGQSYLTYDKRHNYVISKSFTERMPQLKAEKITRAENDAEGRDFKGQVIFKDKETEYILIGNEQQLHAIGSGEPVRTAAYKGTLGVAQYEIYLENGKPVMLYSGDADLDAEQNGVKDFELGEVDDKGGAIYYALGVEQVEGTIDTSWTLFGGEVSPEEAAQGKKYDADENYIIFRDIELKEKWEPLEFKGTMIGAKVGGEYSKLNEILNIEGEVPEANRARIKEVKIESASGALNINDVRGVGFFNTLSSEKSKEGLSSFDDIEGLFTSGPKVTVKNLVLENVTIANQYDTVEDPPQNLIEGVIGLLENILEIPLVGDLLKLLVGDLIDAITQLLDPDEDDVTAAATGAFAGRIYGDVEIANCSVENLQSLSSKQDIAGGFVGSMQGMVEYQELFGTLDSLLLQPLINLLNAIPFLGLGTLLEVLISGGIVNIGELVPTGHKAPTLYNCFVSYGTTVENMEASQLENVNNKNFYGGFVGYQSGARLIQCKVEAKNGLKVNAQNYAGGFAGAVADTKVVAAFSSLGLDLDYSYITNNSFILNCSVNGDVQVSAIEDYAGGLTGVLCNSYLIDSGIEGTPTVNAVNYAGGMVGLSTVGEALALGNQNENNEDLLELIGGLLGNILGGEQDAALLSLAGVYPAVIAGTYIKDGAAFVTATENYAGGLCGRADGTKIINSKILADVENTNDEQNQVSATVAKVWKTANAEMKYAVKAQGNEIRVASVSANNYAAGGVGQALAISMGGIVNSTVGLYMEPFQMQDVTIIGTEDAENTEIVQKLVSATESFAGGAIGLGLGGTISGVVISNLSEVSANNYAGGFAGAIGTGDIVDAGGLNLLGLNLISVNNLLSVGSAIQTEIENSEVQGTEMSVSATGKYETETDAFYAGGFIGNAMAVKAQNCHVTGLASVSADEKAGFAGGFLGGARTEGLADVGEAAEAGKLLNLSGLLDAAPYFRCELNDTTVAYTGNAEVTADVAGGFAGDLQSTFINVPDESETIQTEKKYAVTGIREVNGSTYAGGFAGRIVSGAFVSAGKGLQVLDGILQISAADLVNLIQAYYSRVYDAGVEGNSLRVTASSMANNDSNSGSAGGYLGYGSAMTIENSDVKGLAHTDVKEPKALEDVDGSNYFNLEESAYAVTGRHFAGGYAGKIDIGSTAAVDGKLDVLEGVLGAGEIASALQVMASKIENSDVTGEAKGYSVLTYTDAESQDGIAGGYVGSVEGSEITNSDANKFEYVIGERAAGGYAGRMVAGDVLNLLESTSLLGKLANLSETLASLMSFYVSEIQDSSTSAVPCGGIVRAEAPSDEIALRGAAGGYVGYSEGGQIIGETEECAAIRIRSVYGYEYAGGFTGFAKASETLGAGNVSLLGGLITVSNLADILEIVYPIQTNTAVYGPLQKLDVDTWNSWVEGVGSFGAYGNKILTEQIDSQEEMDAFIAENSYGYQIAAGRSEYEQGAYTSGGGTAGGYIGAMRSGKITDGHTDQVRSVTAMSSAGGFAGEMTAEGIATLGSVGLLGINVINLDSLLGVARTLVPIVKGSTAAGETSGISVQATGTDHEHNCGNAGGFAGRIVGGQINTGDSESNDANAEKVPCTVENLRKVTGTYHIGGFAGIMQTGAAAVINTAATDDEGALNDLLDAILNVGNGNLVQVLEAVITNVEYASVSGMNGQGFEVNGTYKTTAEDRSEVVAYADYAGGFAGLLDGAVLGREDQPNGITVDRLNRVIGGLYAGGMFGLSDVGSVASVTEDGFSILNLIETQEVGLLENFRTYIYNASVTGVDIGFTVTAMTEESYGVNEATYYAGNAGGFGGSLQSGTVQDSSVKNLKKVSGKSYVGGFIGHLDRSGTLDVDEAGVAENNILDLSAGLLDVWGSHIYDSSVEGIDAGFMVRSTGGTFGNDIGAANTEGPLSDTIYVQSMAGGFAGYADNATIIAKDENDEVGCTVNNLKQVSSDGIAGGFVGKTNRAYLASVEADSKLVNALLRIVQGLLDVLHTQELQDINLADIDLGILKVELLNDGNLARVSLLGLIISASLGEPDETGYQTVKVNIGDSEIILHCDEDGKLTDSNTISVHLIKANRTRIFRGKVTGIETGYDVFAGGADNDKDGSRMSGYAGGFVGYNKEGLLENNSMVLADTIRGTSGKVGEFVGWSDLKSTYDGNNLQEIEGNGNTYQVYRIWNNDQLSQIYTYKVGEDGEKTSEKVKLGDASNVESGEEIGGITYYVYTVSHMEHASMYKHTDVWKYAYQTTDYVQSGSVQEGPGIAEFAIKVWISDARADLMLGTPTEDVVSDPTGEDVGIQDPCGEELMLTIQKIWIDNNNKDGERPDQVEVTIKQDNQNYQVSEGKDTLVITSDAANSDPNVWTETVQVPVGEWNEDKTAYTRYYQYDVVEQDVPGYLTTYSKSEDGYTIRITNYRIADLTVKDSVVIDYGLPVNIDVLTEDRIAKLGGTLAAVGLEDENALGRADSSLAQGYGKSVTGTYGKAEANTASGEVCYTPATMQMDSFEKLSYAVNLSGVANHQEGQNFVYGAVNIIPATQIYYEDNFKGSDGNDFIQYNDGTATDGSDLGKWEVVEGDTADRKQDVDRPGKEQVLKDANSIYGYDSNYVTDKTYSSESYHKVEVSAATNAKSPSAVFTFKGTGFDLISLTSNETGLIRMRIYTGEKAEGTPVKTVLVDTYYGYQYKDGEWVVDENSKDALYQIPVVRSEGLNYGTYTVEITPLFLPENSHQGKDSYYFYVDAVRVYGTADAGKEGYEVIEDAYAQDGESNPQYKEIRDILIDGKDVETDILDGVVFVDGKKDGVSLSEYIDYGPKHETYLARGQAIGFYLWASDEPDSVAISFKAARGTAENVLISCAVDENGTWKNYRNKELTCQTTTDLYYDISFQCVWEADGDGYRTKYPIVIANMPNGSEATETEGEEEAVQEVLSLTNLRWTGVDDTQSVEGRTSRDSGKAIKLRAYADMETAQAAFDLLNPKPERTVAVQYQDQNGNLIAETEMFNFTEGNPYDVKELLSKEINGYVKTEIKGDAAQGTVDGDKLITVVYAEKLALNHKYTITKQSSPWFFDIEENGRARILLENMQDREASLNLYRYDESTDTYERYVGSEVTVKSKIGDSGYITLPKGTYKCHLTKKDCFLGDGALTIQYQSVSEYYGEIEDNGTVQNATAIDANITYEGNLNTWSLDEKDADFFAYTLTETSCVSLDLKIMGQTEETDCRISMYASGEENELLTLDSNGKSHMTSGKVQLTAGTYYVCVRGRLAASDGYQLRVNASDYVPVSAILMSGNGRTLKVGEHMKLKASVSPENASYQGVKWESSNETVATVDENGTVTAKGVGTVVITVRSEKESQISASCQVNVISNQQETQKEEDMPQAQNQPQNQPIDSSKSKRITLNKTKANINAGESLRLSLQNAEGNVQWKSKKPSIATVSKNGIVKAKKVGEVKIQAIYAGKTYNCKLIVKPAFKKGTWYSDANKKCYIRIQKVQNRKMRISIRLPYITKKNVTAAVKPNGKVATFVVRCADKKLHKFTITRVGKKVKLKERSSCSKKMSRLGKMNICVFKKNS